MAAMDKDKAEASIGRALPSLQPRFQGCEGSAVRRQTSEHARALPARVGGKSSEVAGASAGVRVTND